MGPLITLGIGQMEIDRGKDRSTSDHSVLFQRGDLKLVPYYHPFTGTGNVYNFCLGLCRINIQNKSYKRLSYHAHVVSPRQRAHIQTMLWGMHV